MSPRPHRVQAAGATYHIYGTATGEELLYRDDDDRERFLAILETTVAQFGLELHFYVLLGTHHHLVVTTTQPNIARAMQYLRGVYCQTYNRRHSRKGHLVAGRYGARLVEAEQHAGWLVPYLALNPVRAGLCRRPEDWPWSSYAALIGLARPMAHVTPGLLLEQFHRDVTEAQRLVRAYVDLLLAEEAVRA